jgi:hypothetical protein
MKNYGPFKPEDIALLPNSNILASGSYNQELMHLRADLQQFLVVLLPALRDVEQSLRQKSDFSFETKFFFR